MDENEKPHDEYEVEVEEFSLDGFQVVRREYFAHTFEPSMSVQYNKVKFNMAAIRKFAGEQTVNFLMDDEHKNQFIVRPCHEDDLDSIKWYNVHKDGKIAGRDIGSLFFSTKFFHDMKWNLDCRYKVAGKLYKTPKDKYLVFDLNRIEIFDLNAKDGEGKNARRRPYLPESMLASYGESALTHGKKVFIDFEHEGLTIIQVKKPHADTGAKQMSMENLNGKP